MSERKIKNIAQKNHFLYGFSANQIKAKGVLGISIVALFSTVIFILSQHLNFHSKLPVYEGKHVRKLFDIGLDFSASRMTGLSLNI